jgi:hypothetical protein
MNKSLRIGRICVEANEEEIDTRRKGSVVGGGLCLFYKWELEASR